MQSSHTNSKLQHSYRVTASHLVFISFTTSQRCKQVIFCKSKSSPKSLIASPKSSPKSMLGVASQVTTYSRVKSSQVTTQCKSCQVTSIWLQVKSSHTHLLHVMYLYFNVQFYFINFIILFGLNIFFKSLNYILSKASDLHCQQVIFSKSQVKSQVMDSKSKSVLGVASQVTSHKNGDSSLTRVQAT